MTHDEMALLFQELGVFTQGHFLLSSGRHGDEYWEKFRIFEHPRVTEQLCALISARQRDQGIEVVVGPTTGGILLAQEVARQLGTRCMIAESVKSGKGKELRRGFVLVPGTRVLVVDDVFTTGLSVRETLEALAPWQPRVVGIEWLIDRSNGQAGAFGVPYHALFTVSARSYAPAECPLCQAGVPLVKPGSRKLPDEQEERSSQ